MPPPCLETWELQPGDIETKGEISGVLDFIDTWEISIPLVHELSASCFRLIYIRDVIEFEMCPFRSFHTLRAGHP